MEKVFGWLSQKTSAQNTAFQEQVFDAAKTLEPEKIQNCAISFNELFSNLQTKELLEQPIKKECNVMLSFMIPLYVELSNKKEDCDALFNCIASSSVFIAARTDSDLLFSLLTSLLSNRQNNHLKQSKQLLKNMLNSNSFVERITSDKSLVSLYTSEPFDPIIYEFMRNAVLKANISSTKNYPLIISSIINTIDTSIPESIIFIGALYKKFGKCMEFETIIDCINTKILSIGNIQFYEDIVKVTTNSKDLIQIEFKKICEQSDKKIIKQILNFISEHPEFNKNLPLLIPKLKNMSAEEQDFFMSIVKIQTYQRRDEIILKMFPPWKYSVECSVLTKYVKEMFSSEMAERCLMIIFAETKFEEQCVAFESIPMFQDLIINLLQQIDNYDNVENYFNKLVQMVCSGHETVLRTVESLCKYFPPVTYKNVLICDFSDLKNIPSFIKMLAKLIKDNAELRMDLLCEEFIEITIKNKTLDLIAMLAADGPHKIIDECVTQLFDEFLSDLTQNQLQKLAFGMSQESSSNVGTIRIPSILPRLSEARFSSLFDRYAAGKYLIDNDLLSIESPILPDIGVQCLSEKLASQLIDNPALLSKITNPDFPHQPVIQFQEKREASFITIGMIPTSFSFRVDNFKNPFVLFSAGGYTFMYNGESLTCNESNIVCTLGTWHTIDISFPNDKIDVFIDGHRGFYLNLHETKCPIIIGSTNIAPESTFYIKSHLVSNDGKKEQISYQGGCGILNVGYSGIAVFAPLINAVPRLLQKLLVETNEESFRNIFQSLLNIESFDCVSLSVNDFLGFIRVIFCERNQMVTEQIIESAFSFICTNGKIDWLRFKRLFIDYKLWVSCFDKMGPIIEKMTQIYQEGNVKGEEVEVTSLLHFLIDLIIYCNIHDDALEDLILLISKNSTFSKSSLIIHILNKEPTNFVKRMIDEVPDLLGSVPFQFLPHMSHELVGKYLNEIASVCCHNEDAFSQVSINKMLPLLSRYVQEESFWISMFTLLTKVRFDSLTLFSHSEVKREGMLHPIFMLICDLFKEEEENENCHLLFPVVDTLNSIIKVSNVRMSNFINDMQILLHFGVSSKTIAPMPITFNNFEACRMPAEEENRSTEDDQIIDIIDTVEMPRYESPFIDDLIGATDLWFGLPSTPFVEACKKETRKVEADFDAAVLSSQESDDDLEQDETRRITNSPVHQFIVEFAATALAELNGEALRIALKQTTIFGPEVDPKLSIVLHQLCIMKMLSITSVSKEALDFIRKMVCVGWWENKLPDLFNAVLLSFEHYQGFMDDEDYAERWSSLSMLIKTILALSIDYSQFHFVQHSSIIFNREIISQKSYFLFILYVLMTNEFSRSSQIQAIWISFSNLLGSLEDSQLSAFLPNVFTRTEEIAANIHELAIRTNYFLSVGEDDLALVNKLKNVCCNEYESFINERQNEMQALTDSVKDIRQAVKETSDEYKETLVKVINQNAQKTEKCLRHIEKFSFKARFNLVSHENERSAYHLWSLLPNKENDKFQLCPTVHPLSTPILYVPLSSKINPSKPKEYCDYQKHMKVTRIGDSDIKHSFAPPTLDPFVSMPFFETNPDLHNFLFRASFRHYGQIRCFSKLTIVFGTMRVKCALANAENGFYIITEAKSLDGKLLLKSNKPNLAIVTFLDSLAYKYYGSCSLFYGHCVLFMSTKHVVNVVPRNYCHMPTAIEVWFARGYSLFLVFNNQEERDEFSKKLNHREFFPPSISLFGPSFSNKLCSIVGKPNEIKKLSEEWVLGTLSSQTYLSCLNFLADRSFSNFCQYPIMPWVLPERNMAKPMGQQNEERAASFQETYETSAPDNHFYGSHYSSAAVVMHFLMRIQPFSNLHFELNNGFDHQDRLFSDIQREWESSSKLSSHNVEEMIPEFFLLPESLTNVNKLPIPATTSNINQDNVELLPNTPNPVAFVWWLRKTLDDNEHLEKWINLIFGAFSRGQEARIHKNLFYPCTYGIKSSLVIDEESFEQMKRCFGQTPTQIFTEPHPPRNTVCFKRTPLLLDQKVIFTQVIKAESKEVKDPIIVKTRTSYGIESCAVLYSNLSHSQELTFTDSLLTWRSFTIDDLVTSSFSTEKLLFCGVFSSGAMQICRSICKEDGSIVGYYPLSSCTMPINVQLTEPIKCCAISSHHFVACEATGKDLFCFHVGTGHFIRCIHTEENIQSVHIDDSFSCFYIFCVSSIQVFTINGTFVGKTQCESPIISSSISCNDVDVFAATAHEDGVIRFWRANASECVIECVKSVESPDKDILCIELLRGGSVLISVNKGNAGVVFVSNGAGKGIISSKSAAKCASCLRSDVKLNECQSCGLFYCDKCSTPESSSICFQCLKEIEECTDF